MVTITHSDAAPTEPVNYSFSGINFEIKGKDGKYETDDPFVISNALVHPWLHVEFPKPELVKGAYVQQLLPKDDAMSAINDKSNDPAEVRKTEEAKASEMQQPVAIDAGLDQTEAVTVEAPPAPPVAITIEAANDAAKDKGK